MHQDKTSEAWGFTRCRQMLKGRLSTSGTLCIVMRRETSVPNDLGWEHGGSAHTVYWEKTWIHQQILNQPHGQTDLKRNWSPTVEVLSYLLRVWTLIIILKIIHPLRESKEGVWCSWISPKLSLFNAFTLSSCFCACFRKPARPHTRCSAWFSSTINHFSSFYSLL